MKHSSMIMACATVLMSFVSGIQARGQIDPNVGRSLSQQLENAEQIYRSLEEREKSLSTPDRFIGTYESKLIENNTDDCQSIIVSAKQEIYSLNYGNAKKELSKFERLVEATQTMLDEDAKFSGKDLRKVSVLDDGYAPEASLPKLQGPALRATIASEISFAQRTITRSGLTEIDYAVTLADLPPSYLR